ncbi:MAG: hypothetical protein KF757_01105 [Phycisphaeraceae bacterium]|nr:hypothetical protein [Phycisphaeraceae bacterium]MCW5761806.1 hypothetical protein [Phycisphaeraceae bacterium]
MRTLLAVCVIAIGTLAGLARAGEPAIVGIERVTQIMVESVLAGDTNGYLEVVSRTDPIFWTEQRNWASDLREHTPALFEIVLDREKLIEQRDGSVTMPMEMRWKLSPEARQRSVSFVARFVRGESEWQYAGEHWTRVEAAGAEVLVDPELATTGLHIAHTMPRVRSAIDTLMDASIEGQPQVKLYRTMAHLQHSIYLSYVEPLGGWNEPGEAIKLVHSQQQTGRALRTLLAHEYGHFVTFAMGEHATDMPWWVLEGVAEWCAAAFDRSAATMDRRVRRWAAGDNLRQWHQLADFRGEAMDHMSHVYLQGHHMVQFIIDRSGREAMLAWLRAMANGSNLDDATLTVLGLSFEELDAAWRAQIVPEPALAD